MNTDQFTPVRELVGKPIENINQLCEFVKTLDKAGIGVSYGTSLFCYVPIGNEDHISIKWCAGFDSESWSRRGTKIVCEKDEHGSFTYRLSEASGWWFNFTFSINCIVTDIKWDVPDEYPHRLPTIVLSRFYMPIGDLLDEQKRRDAIIKNLESKYDEDIKSIGQTIFASNEDIHIIHSDQEECCYENYHDWRLHNMCFDEEEDD